VTKNLVILYLERNISLLSSELKSKPNKKPVEAGEKLAIINTQNLYEGIRM
jgi:hypothetical protein